MDKGILLIALGKHYTQLAYNMAKSIKRFSDIPIAVVTDDTEQFLLDAFDIVIEPKLHDYIEGYAFNPFKFKTYVYDYTPFEHTIYLDVDGIALKDITPLFAHDFLIQEVARYNYENAHTCDMVWVKKAGLRLNDVYDAYGLDHKREYPEYNSSIIVFKKNNKNETYFLLAKKLYLDRKLAFKPIGGLYPDELAWNLASALLKHYNEDKIKPIYFFWENRNMTGTDIVDNYYILGMAGGFHKTKLKSLYETTVKAFSPYWKFDSMKKIFHSKK